MEQLIKQLLPLLAAYMNERGLKIEDYLGPRYRLSDISKQRLTSVNAAWAKVLNQVIVGLDHYFVVDRVDKSTNSVILTILNGGKAVSGTSAYFKLVDDIVEVSRAILPAGSKLKWGGSPVTDNLLADYKKGDAESLMAAYIQRKQAKRQTYKIDLGEFSFE